MKAMSTHDSTQAPGQYTIDSGNANIGTKIAAKMLNQTDGPLRNAAISVLLFRSHHVNQAVLQV